MQISPWEKRYGGWMWCSNYLNRRNEDVGDLEVILTHKKYECVAFPFYFLLNYFFRRFAAFETSES